MYRIMTNLGQPFGECYLPKVLGWQYDSLGMPIFDPVPPTMEYWEFETSLEAHDWIDTFIEYRCKSGGWVPARNQFRVEEV
jgi:hypothetical protein